MVAGDTTPDLKMARAAGAGVAVGVLCGVSSAKDLLPHADILIESVDELHTFSLVHANEAAQPLSGLNPDLAT